MNRDLISYMAHYKKQYLDKKVKEIIKAVEKLQAKFFLTGNIEDLKPMSQKDISNKTGLNRSIISRSIGCCRPSILVKGKEYSLRDLLSEGVSGKSALYLKTLIRNMVEEESPYYPMSDVRITKALNDLGIPIKRRTVTKYRQAMEIPSLLERHPELKIVKNYDTEKIS